VSAKAWLQGSPAGAPFIVDNLLAWSYNERMDLTGFRRLPFSAIVGQEKLKKAYLANIVNPRIGGLLISGPKGTGKSTLVHSVSGILPDFQAVASCPFNCDPGTPGRLCTLCRERGDLKAEDRRMRIVNLPLSCSEDRLVGSIDVERLLKSGDKVILPGILGQANGNILYVDEVNLLPDHLVDDILDAAASGWNTIEREGLSVHHPARFVLVGTMNPEEGDLRPQILDRFPLCVKIETVRDPRLRAEIVRLNLRYENDPAGFFASFDQNDLASRDSIVAARSLLPRVAVTDAQVLAVAESCAELKVDGQRPDIVIVKTGLTLAALEGRTMVSAEDLMLAAELALCHRTRDGGLLEPPDRNEIQGGFSKRFDRLSPSAGKDEVQKQSESQELRQQVKGTVPGLPGVHEKKN
jgi:Mg-chelatase subunit ChlI